MHVSNADGTGFDGIEADCFEQPQDLREVDMTVTVAEMPCQTSACCRRSGEINDQRSPAWLDDSA